MTKRRKIESVGERMKRLRTKLGLAQCKAAEKAGISKSHWNDLEHGKYQPTLGTLMKVARALKTTMSAMWPG